MKKSFCALFLISTAAFLFSTSVSYGQTTGYSNVRISDAVTSGGEWSGSNGDGWVFSPTADNANVQASDIESKLNAGTVSITTVNTSGTQLGSVYVDDDVRSYSNLLAGRYLHIKSQGIIEVNDNILMTTSGSGSYYYKTHDLRLEAVGDISINATVSTKGSSNSVSSRLKNSGSISILSGGVLRITADVESSGPDNTYNNSSAYGGGAGALLLRGALGVVISSDISSKGGDSNYLYGTRYGTTGAIEISTDNGVVTDGGNNDGQLSGVIAGGAFTKSGSGVLRVTGSNDWTSTAIDAGTLQMGSSGSIPSSKNLLLSGGTLESFGAAKSYGSLSFTANSSIELGSGDHTITFSSRGSFGSAVLTIKGWVGTYGGSGTSGTEGNLKINTTLSAAELAKIKFYNSLDGLYYAALQLSTKEIVPGAVIP